MDLGQAGRTIGDLKPNVGSVVALPARFAVARLTGEAVVVGRVAGKAGRGTVSAGPFRETLGKVVPVSTATASILADAGQAVGLAG